MPSMCRVRAERRKGVVTEDTRYPHGTASLVLLLTVDMGPGEGFGASADWSTMLASLMSHWGLASSGPARYGTQRLVRLGGGVRWSSSSARAAYSSLAGL